MGDPSKFQTMQQYGCFMIAFIGMFVMEGVIAFLTRDKGENAQVERRDQGTKGLLYLCCFLCIYLSFFFESTYVSKQVRNLALPPMAAWAGIVLIVAGTTLRFVAVRTLKKAFTLKVQTTKDQKLIENGVYSKVRNPAYTGSIISLLGIAVSLRNVLAILMVLIICMFCYRRRIQVEEKALEDQFGTRYVEYERRTYRLFPFVW